MRDFVIKELRELEGKGFSTDIAIKIIIASELQNISFNLFKDVKRKQEELEEESNERAKTRKS